MNSAIVIIFIIILFILVLGLGGLNYFLVTKNNEAAVQQTLKPFSARIDPTTGNISKGGFSGQLSCPAGTSIQIVSAFYDIDDPYAVCSSSINNVNPLVAFMCNPSVNGPGTCSKNSGSSNQCPSGTECQSGKCKLQSQPSNYTGCPKNAPLTKLSDGNYYCINSNVCGAGVPNPICQPKGVPPGNTGGCAIRDASASVSQKCNGRSDCDDLSVKDFGKTPCNFAASPCWSQVTSDGPVWITDRTGYCGLPYGPGWGGGAPAYGSSSDAGSGNLGYTMHGIYSCIAN